MTHVPTSSHSNSAATSPRLKSFGGRVKLLDLGQEHYHVGRVSILMPVLNSERHLLRAVASVLAQSYTNWELLIVDDGSQDRTWPLTQQMTARDSRIRAARHGRNQGPAQARNRALAAATGQYIAFLDGDDTWQPDKLAKQIAFMHQTGAAFSHTAFWRAHNERRHLVPVPEFYTYHELLRFNVIGCLTAIYDRAYFGSVPMPELPIREDTALWFTLLQMTQGVHGLNTPLATHFHHHASLSASRWRAQMASWRLFRQFVGLSRRDSFYCQASHLWHRIKRG